MQLLRIRSQLRMRGKDHEWRFIFRLFISGDEHLPTSFLHGIGQGKGVVLVIGDCVILAGAGKSARRPGEVFHRHRGGLFACGKPHPLRLDTHHERQRPCGHVVGFEDPAAGRRVHFGITLYPHHLFHKAAIRLGIRN